LRYERRRTEETLEEKRGRGKRKRTECWIMKKEETKKNSISETKTYF
jgi:hypothetical protein